jgi:signal transduction histidine kinase
MMTLGNLIVTWPRRMRAHWPALLLPVLGAAAIGLIRSHQIAAELMPVFVMLFARATAAAVLVPAAAARIAPYALFGYGCAGLVAAHLLLAWRTPELFYGVVNARAGRGSLAWALLPEAFCFLAAALWLLVVTGAPGARAVRAAVSQLRAVGGGPRTVPALLLLPVIGLWQEAYASWLWSGSAWGKLTAVEIAAAGIWLVARQPRLAAVLAVPGLLGFGCVLLISAPHGSESFIYWAARGPDWSDAYFGNGLGVFSGLYGPVLLDSQPALWLTRAEGALLIAAGCALAPLLPAWGADSELARRATALAQRVDRLTRSRSDVTDTAVAELRRIERDLHDGAQARIVAVGMSLRAAEELMRTDPEAARALVAEARETSSRALNDLRGLVRGIYPPVLADRGLADAVRSLALDTPLSVETEITLAGEPPMPVAAAVYFGIAEALTNAVRHSGADVVQICVGYAGLLRATVIDNGGGGADAARGTGLAGVERRLAAFDGILAVTSPPGGPTIVAIEVPCALADDTGRTVRLVRQPAG